MNTAINTTRGNREHDRQIANAILCRVEGNDDEAVIFLDEIGENGELLTVNDDAEATGAAIDPEAFFRETGWRLEDAIDEANDRKAHPRGYSHEEARLLEIGDRHGIDVAIVRGSRRRTH